LQGPVEIYQIWFYAYVGNDPLNYGDPDGLVLEAIGDFLSNCAENCYAISYFTSSQWGVRPGIAGLLNACGALCDPGAYASIAPALGPGMAVAETAGATFRGLRAIVGLSASAAEEAGLAANSARGLASEARVLQDLGLTKNTQSVLTAEGRSIPDALTDSLSVEIKDSANVSLTRQLRIQTDAARAAGRDSVLITGDRTCISANCSAAFDQIVRRPDLGPR
jgi:hypothetical protein